MNRPLKKLKGKVSGHPLSRKNKPEEIVKQKDAEIAHLKELLRSKDDFIRVTTHELRTPLDVMRGNLDMVLKGDTGNISVATREYLSDALLGADRLSKLVRDMLEISKFETGRFKLALKELDLHVFFKSIENEFTPVANKKDIKLSIQIQSYLPNVFSDQDRVYQIMDNLLGNALKLTPKGGSVTISAKRENDFAIISVQDTGIGIRPEDQKKLFKRFPEIEMGLLEEQKGTGLGLSLVWQIVKKLGGDVWAKSEGLGKGATFSFKLPCAGSETAEKLSKLEYAAVVKK